MNTKSFVDVYEQMIRKRNINNNNNVNDHTDIIKEADSQEQQKEDEQEQLDLDLDLDENKEEEQVEDQQEQLQQQDQQDFSLEDEQEKLLDNEPQTEYKKENYGEENEVAFNFPDALMTEFINTVNQFTRLCAEVVQNKSVTTGKSQDLDKLMEKIKNLKKAAQKSI